MLREYLTRYHGEKRRNELAIVELNYESQKYHYEEIRDYSLQNALEKRISELK
jgi:hypothetical protein